MQAVRRTRPRVAPSVAQCAVLSVLAVLAGCGGETGNSEPAKSKASGGATAVNGDSGGSSAITPSTGGIMAAAGGSTGGVGAGSNGGQSGVGAYGPLDEPSSDDECKNGDLQLAIRFLSGAMGPCRFWLEGEPLEGVDLTPFPVRGAAVFDSEGRIVEVLGSGSLSYLETYASERWPCYADQTVEYACSFML